MKLFFTLLFFYTIQLVSGQQLKLSGKVIETFSKVPIPFAHIIINEDTHLFTDLEGKFEFASQNKILKLQCGHYMHRPYLGSNISSDTITIKMNRFEFFKDELTADPQGIAVMQDVLSWRNHNNPDFYSYYTYSTYNKFTLTPGNIADANKMIKSFSAILPGRLKELHPNQHLLLVESASDKEYLNDNNHRETIKSTRSSGVSVPSAFFKTSQLQATNIYSDYIIVNGKEYVSPLSKTSLEQYNFNVIDSAIIDQRKLRILKFNPKPDKNFDGLRGQLYVDDRYHAVRYYSTSPMDDNTMSATIYQEFQLVDDQKWFPKASKTENLTYKGLYEVKYTSSLFSRVYNIKSNTPLSKHKFDE
ncbi:MAG TPA: DUF5686 family protein, partial [Cytophagaceae bacterium]